jgi:hypothetical protein
MPAWCGSSLHTHAHVRTHMTGCTTLHDTTVLQCTSVRRGVPLYTTRQYCSALQLADLNLMSCLIDGRMLGRSTWRSVHM